MIFPFILRGETTHTLLCTADTSCELDNVCFQVHSKGVEGDAKGDVNPSESAQSALKHNRTATMQVTRHSQEDD